MSLKAAKCPECGADLRVEKDADFVRCDYCDRDVQVRKGRKRGSAKKTVDNWLALAQQAEEANNHKEAYQYYTKVLEADGGVWQAHCGKARAAGSLSTLKETRLAEMTLGLQRGIDLAPDSERQDERELAALSVTAAAMHHYQQSHSHFLDFKLEDTWEEHVVRGVAVLAALREALNFNKEREAAECGLTVAKELLEGDFFKDKDETQRLRLNESDQLQVREHFEYFALVLKDLDPSFEKPEIHDTSSGCLGGCLVATIVVAGLLLGYFCYLFYHLT